MAHEIESIAYANEVPWHGLGARLDDSASAQEFMKAASLDWRVDLYPLSAHVEGELVEVPGRFALIRDKDKKVMTVCGQSWRPFQNSEMIDFMSRYVAAGGAKMETAGSLRGGKIVWGLAKLGHSFQVRPGDRVEGYMLFTVPHVVGQAHTIRTTSVRVVCANTMAMAEHEGQVNYRQNHLSDFDISSAKAAVELAHEELAAAERRAKTIDKLKLTAEDTVLKVLVPVFMPEVQTDSELIKNIMQADVMPKRISQIMDSIENAPGAINDTGWGVLNGITHWVDHVQGHTNESRMYRAWVGDYGRKKLEAEQVLLELAS